MPIKAPSDPRGSWQIFEAVQEKTILGLRPAGFSFAPCKGFSTDTCGSAADQEPLPSYGHQGVSSLLPPAQTSKRKYKPCKEKHLSCPTSICLTPQLPQVPFMYIIDRLGNSRIAPFSKKLAEAHRKGAATTAISPNLKHRKKNMTFCAFNWRDERCSPTEDPT